MKSALLYHGSAAAGAHLHQSELAVGGHGVSIATDLKEEEGEELEDVAQAGVDSIRFLWRGCRWTRYAIVYCCISYVVELGDCGREGVSAGSCAATSDLIRTTENGLTLFEDCLIDAKDVLGLDRLPR